MLANAVSIFSLKHKLLDLQVEESNTNLSQCKRGSDVSGLVSSSVSSCGQNQR